MTRLASNTSTKLSLLVISSVKEGNVYVAAKSMENQQGGGRGSFVKIQDQ